MTSHNLRCKFLLAAMMAATLGACASSPSSTSYGSAPPPAVNRCYECGTVERIEVLEVSGRSSGGGAVLGGIVGGVLGNQVGKGDGKKAATVAGVVGGAVAGNAIEKRSVKHDYRITVRMDDGRRVTVTQPTISANLREGSVVRIDNGRAILMR